MTNKNQTDSPFSLETLASIIHQRAQSNDDNSYTRMLITNGTEHCTKKFGEEAVELVISAIQGDKVQVVRESADVLYHFLVMLKAADIDLNEVMSELKKRTSQSGLEEKASR